MTKQSLTSINIILDRSGSMSKLTAETILGFNKFLSDQKLLEGEAKLTLATFANDYTLVHDFCSLKSVNDLSVDNYRTGGYTALLDAVAKTIDATGARLAAMPEEERPGKVIFVIITDGQENYSKDFNRDQVLSKITHQREKYNWEFVFLGADESQIGEAVSIGVSTRNAVKYVADAKGVGAAYSTISSNMLAYRSNSSQNVDFFDQVRDNKNMTFDIDLPVVPSTTMK